MLWNIAIIFALLWAVGVLTSNTLGGFIHVLFFSAIALLFFRVIKVGRASG
jgi:hypothetical protein